MGRGSVVPFTSDWIWRNEVVFMSDEVRAPLSNHIET